MSSKSRVANAALNTSAGLVAKLVNILTGFVMRTVFIYTLGIAYTGVSSLFTDILSMLSFAEMGISGAISFALYKPVAEGDHKRVGALMNFYKKAYRKVALAVFLAGMALIPFMGVLVPADKIDASNPAIRDQILSQLTIIYVLYVINSAISYLLIYKTAILTAHQEQRYSSIVQVVMSLIRVVIECAVLFGFRWTKYCFIIYLIVGIILTRTQNAISSYIAVKRHPQVNEYLSEQLPKEEQKKLFSNVKALMIYKLCTTINSGLDSIVISSMFGTLWVGFVSNYRLVTAKLLVLINQFYGSVTPSVGNLATLSTEEKQHRTFKNLLFLSFWLICFCCTSLLVLINPFIEIWLGEQYTKSFMLVLSLVINFYLGCIIHPISTFRISNGLFKEGQYRPVAMLVINVIASFGLAFWLGNKYGDEWGVIGVKLATCLSHLLTLQWFDPLIVYKHVFKKSVKLYYKQILIYTGIAVGCAAVTYLLGMMIPDINKYVRFLILAVLCLIIPNAAIILIFRKTEEYKAIIAIFGKLTAKLKNKLTRSGSKA